MVFRVDVGVIQVRIVLPGIFQRASAGIGVRELLQHPPEDVRLHGIIEPGVGRVQVRRGTMDWMSAGASSD